MNIIIMEKLQLKKVTVVVAFMSAISRRLLRLAENGNLKLIQMVETLNFK